MKTEEHYYHLRDFYSEMVKLCYCSAYGRFADSCSTHKIQIQIKQCVLWAYNQGNMHAGFIHLFELQMSTQEILINILSQP